MAHSTKDPVSGMCVLMLTSAEAAALYKMALAGNHLDDPATARILFGSPSQVEATRRAFAELKKLGGPR